MPGAQRRELLDYYVSRLAMRRHDRAKTFRKTYYHFVLTRLLQAMGAFGLRGLYEGKRHFEDSILPGLKTLSGLFEPGCLEKMYPEIQRAVELALAKYFVPSRQ